MGAACSSERTHLEQAQDVPDLQAKPQQQQQQQQQQPEQQRQEQKQKQQLEKGGGSGSGVGSGDPRSWRDLLLAAADMDLWDGVRREHRADWKQRLEHAQTVVQQPRKPLPQAMVDRVMMGDLEELSTRQISCFQPRVVIFISSTFTDTKAERNMLMRDVYPYIRLVCRTLGLDFGTVDMRWGVREEATKGHETVNMCLREVDRCKRESVGPAFLGIMAEKYGYRPPPSEIPQTEMDQLFSSLGEESEESAFLRQHYRLDTNAIPPEYDLLARSDENTDWWTTEGRIQQILRQAAKALDPETAEKYFISVTEKEIVRGVFENANRGQQVVLIERSLTGLREAHHQHRHLIDMQAGTIDEDAQQHLQQLREHKFKEKAGDICDVHLKFEYEKDDESCHDHIRELCDTVCTQLLESVLKNYLENLHIEQDELFQEIAQHGYFLLDKSRVFVGRDDLIQNIVSYCNGDTEEGNSILAVHGQSGCGKTALLAVACQRTQNLHKDGVMVVRFLGTTANSGSARAVLLSVCTQITRAYGGDPKTIPTSYRELIPHFMKCMAMATAAKPLYMFLDSLDQLSNEDMGHNLKWLHLKEKLPPHVHLVVSTLPNQCSDILNSHLPTGHMVEVTPLELKDGPLILNKMLAVQNRKVTAEQESVILDAFEQCPLPLFLRLIADMAVRWHSYDEIGASELSTDMPGLVTKLFCQLESWHGERFVSRALSYITAAKNGLSVAELEDVISCDDEVLDEIFAFWIPPFRRVPQLLWIRIRNDLGPYLVERGTDGTSVYSWYHRQFWETAERKYLATPENRTHAHQALADYFEGKYTEGKYYVPTSKKDSNQQPRVEDRQVPTQPLVLYGDRQVGRVYNRRKLTELPYHLGQLGDADSIKRLLLSLECLEAKFACGKGYDLQSELRQAAIQTKDETIKKTAKFIGASLGHLLLEPEAIYQLASQQAPTNPLRELAEKADWSQLTRSRMRSGDEVLAEDPCDMTLTGHTSGVRCCRYSAGGELIVSVAEDASLRVWDAYNGAELVTVTGLPGPQYPALADPYHGERVVTFDRTDQFLVAGSEDGGLQILDRNGAMRLSRREHTAGVTGVAFTPDNAAFVTCSKDRTVKVWNLTDGSVKKTIPLTGQALNCAFSPRGDRLAVTMTEGAGLSIIDVSTWEVTSTGNGLCSLNLCVAWSPISEQIITGGDNSAITVWNSSTARILGSWMGHRAWIWSVAYTPDGSRVFSCSSDRTLRVWDASSGAALFTLGGHLHRLTWVDIRPGGDQFVTCSLDYNLKVWDMPAVLSGNVPPVGQLHYILLTCTPDDTVISCQGWSTACNVSKHGGAFLGSSASHDGFMNQTAITCSSSRLVTMDTGHKGAYEAGAARLARVMVTDLPSMSTHSVDATATTAIGANHNSIAIGTLDGQLHLINSESLERRVTFTWDSQGSPADGSVTDITRIDVAVSGHVAASCSVNVKIWQTSSPEPTLIGELRGSVATDDNGLVSDVRYSPDGGHLVLGTVGGTVSLYQSPDYTLVQQLAGHVGLIKDIRFSHDGRWLGTVGGEGSLRVWATSSTGYQLHSVYYAPINCIGWLRDNSIVTGEATGNRGHLMLA